MSWLFPSGGQVLDEKNKIQISFSVYLYMSWYLGEMADQPRTALQLLAQKPESLWLKRIAMEYGPW